VAVAVGGGQLRLQQLMCVRMGVMLGSITAAVGDKQLYLLLLVVSSCGCSCWLGAAGAITADMLAFGCWQQMLNSCGCSCWW
jgi:hypothetical protein